MGQKCERYLILQRKKEHRGNTLPGFASGDDETIAAKDQTRNPERQKEKNDVFTKVSVFDN